jgi:hypothetical protein
MGTMFMSKLMRLENTMLAKTKLTVLSKTMVAKGIGSQGLEENPLLLVNLRK